MTPETEDKQQNNISGNVKIPDFIFAQNKYITFQYFAGVDVISVFSKLRNVLDDLANLQKTIEEVDFNDVDKDQLQDLLSQEINAIEFSTLARRAVVPC